MRSYSPFFTKRFCTDVEQIRTDLLALDDYDRVETFYRSIEDLWIYKSKDLS